MRTASGWKLELFLIIMNGPFKVRFKMHDVIIRKELMEYKAFEAIFQRLFNPLASSSIKIHIDRNVRFIKLDARSVSKVQKNQKRLFAPISSLRESAEFPGQL